MKNRNWKFKMKIGACILGCGLMVWIGYGLENSKSISPSIQHDLIKPRYFESIIELSEVDLAAPPLSSGQFNLTNEERHIIQCIVAGEAKGEPMEGKMAVAQCILNAMVKDDLSVREVQNRYQYSGWDDQLMVVNLDAWVEVCEAVSRVFDDGERVTDEFILWFYAPRIVRSSWHETQKFVIEIGGHRFFAPWG